MLDVNSIIIVLAIVTVVDLCFGTILFFLDKDNPINQLFSLWMIALATWTLAVLGYFGATDTRIATMWMRGSYSAGIIAVMAFFYFSTQFPRKTKLTPILHVINMLTLVLFSVAANITPLIVVRVSGTPGNWAVVLSDVGWVIYAIYLLYLFGAAHIILIKKYFESKGVERKQLAYVVLSVLIGGGILGVFFNLILPSPIFSDWSLIWLGPLSATVIIVPFVAYAVTKHNLFNARGVVTEVIIGFAVMFAIMDAFVFNEPWEFVLRSFIAGMLAIFGFKLIKSIRQEEKERIALQQLSRELSVANAHLRQVDEAKSEFLSIASHELRTPVSVVKGYLSLILEGVYGKVNDEVRQKLKEMFRMNERLIRIINNLLNTSRIETNRVEFAITEFDSAELVDAVVEEMHVRTGQKGISLMIKRPKKRLPMVLADPELTHEIIGNLIDNAVKYSPENAKITISLSLSDDGSMVEFRMKDTGIGMTAAARKNIFKRFYRVSNEETRRQKGTGLGLYICKTFVEGMGGEIRVEDSVPGKGSTFMFTLPVAEGIT